MKVYYDPNKILFIILLQYKRYNIKYTAPEPSPLRYFIVYL